MRGINKLVNRLFAELILLSYLSLKFALSPAVLFSSLVSNFCLIYCDLKFNLYKWSKCKVMAMAGLK